MSTKTKAKELRQENQNRTAMQKALSNRGEDLHYRAREMGSRSDKAYKRERIKFL